MSRIKVLITDDSPLIRKLLTSTLRASDEFEVLGEAKNGFEALEMCKALKPDVVTMDVEMPRCNGLEALEAIMKTCPTPVLMLSSLTAKGAKETLRALELGAYDFIQKPENRISGMSEMEAELFAKLKSSKQVRHAAPRPAMIAPPAPKFVPGGKCDKIVVIASSTGGPKALTTLFEALPAGFPAPILIAQHMPAGFTQSLAERLDNYEKSMVLEAAHGMAILPGQTLIAPGQKHLIVNKGKVELNEEPPLHGVRPAADFLFMSAAKAYGNKCIGVVLTGMGKDGAQGAFEVRRAGGYTIGEAESTCTVYGMPKAAKDKGGISTELPLHEIAAELARAVKGEARNAA